MKANQIFLALVVVSCTSFAQSFNYSLDSNRNFYQIQQEFNKYWENKDTIPRSKGYKQFRRWEWYWEPRVYPSGNFPDFNSFYNFSNAEEKTLKDKQQAPLWSFMGPTQSIGGYYGMGRVNVAKSPVTNENIIYAGAASGGLWKSTDAGTSWSTNTDNFSSLGITDILIHPSNSSIVYLATGDADNIATFSIGVLKSTNAGATWNSTGLVWSTSQMKRIYKMVMNPSNNNIIYAVGNNGVDKSTNGGTNWTNINTGTFYDIELKPGDPNTVYVVGTQFQISTNGGSNWDIITAGLPQSGITRCAIAVTPATGSGDNVYLLASNSEYGYGGFFLSTNGGFSWQNRSNTPNLLGWTTTGADAGGQGWYDLCLAVSPLDPTIIFVGGINIWKSENSGSSWSLETNWYPTNTVNTVHADHHDLWFLPGSNTLYSANDGGVYRKRENGNWSWLGSGLNITQFYRLGISKTNQSLIIGGTQDNGTKLFNSGNFSDIRGGDGMECAVDYTDENIMYSTLPNGGLGISQDKGQNFTNIKPSGARGSWVAPFVLHPSNPSTLFIGMEDVYKSTNSGTNWSRISSFGLTGNLALNFLVISKSDPNYIYAGRGTGLFKKSTNGGTNWTNLNYPANLWLNQIEIHPEDPAKIWAIFSGFSVGNKVYYSTDGGSNWTNISGTLPNIPINTIVYEENSNDRLYIGTDVGIYYTDNSKSDWISYSDDLPNVVIGEIEIQYSSSKLRAATYGRGIWEAPLVSTIVTPIITGANNICEQSTQTYKSNISTGYTKVWTITNGTLQNASTSDSAIVNWSTSGFGKIKLIITSTSTSKRDSTEYNVIINKVPTAIITGLDTVCFSSVQQYIANSGTNKTNKWVITGGNLLSQDTATIISVEWNTIPNGLVKLIQTTNNSTCSDSSYITIVIKSVPKPIITGKTLPCFNVTETYTTSFSTGITPDWMVTGGKVISNSGNSISIKWDIPSGNSIRLKFTDNNSGCYDSTLQIINIIPLPAAVINGNNLACNGSTEIYSTPSSSVHNFKWEVVGGNIIGSDSNSSVNVKWTTVGNQNLTFSKIDKSTSCRFDSIYSVQVGNRSNPLINGSNSICKGSVVNYSCQSFSGVKTKWEVNGGTINGNLTDSTVLIQWDLSGNGSVMLIQTTNIGNCPDTSRMSITINDLPKPDFSGVTMVCSNCTETYTSNSPIHSNSWKVINGTPQGPIDQSSVTVKWNSSGLSELALIQTDKATLCRDSSVKQITISALSKPVISGVFSACELSKVKYSTSTSIDFENKWTAFNGVIDGPDSLNYVDIVWQNSKGTIKLLQKNIQTQILDSTEQNVEVNNKPEKPIVSRTGDSLKSTAISGNQWFLDSIKITGAVEQIFKPETDGNYSVQITDQNNCQSDISETFIFNLNSVNEESIYGIKIYPNPAASEINIDIQNMLSEKMLVIINDLNGNEIYKKVHSRNAAIININTERLNGTYILRIYSGDKVINTIITVIN